MKPSRIALALAPMLLTAAVAQAAEPTTKPADHAATTRPAGLKTLDQRAGYFIGLNMGQNFGAQLKQGNVEVDINTLVMGFRDALLGNKPQLSMEDGQATMAEFQQIMQAKMMKHQQEMTAKNKIEGEKHKAEGEAYLAKNKTAEGVKTTASGLQYKVLKEGKGASPLATDTVKVHYRGTFIDGTEFDSSYKRGEPAEFQLNGVIPGWTEGVQLMKSGGKMQFTVPSDLAYGPNGNQGIPPSKTLIFEVELLEIKK